MNPSNPVTDLVQFHQSVLNDLVTLYPSPWTVAWYPRIPYRIPVPYIGLELTAAVPTHGDNGNIGTEQIQLDLRCEAFVFTDYRTPDYRIKSRLYGIQLAAFLLGHQWAGVAGGPCRIVDSAEDRWSDSGAAQYDCWRVEWEQTCLFNTDIFSGGIIPSEIFLGFLPNVGTGHEADYLRIQ